MSAHTLRQQKALRLLRPVVKQSLTTPDPAPWWIWPLLFACAAVVVGAEIFGRL
jgi:hypothetical protein